MTKKAKLAKLIIEINFANYCEEMRFEADPTTLNKKYNEMASDIKKKLNDIKRQAIAIKTQPKSPREIKESDSVTFGVIAVGSDLQYQWQLSVDNGINWEAIPNAIASSFTIPSVAPEDNGKNFRVMIRDCISNRFPILLS